MNVSMDWFKGKLTGNHGIYHEIWGFPVNVPLNQSIEFSRRWLVQKGWFWPKKNNVFWGEMWIPPDTAGISQVAILIWQNSDAKPWFDPCHLAKQHVDLGVYSEALFLDKKTEATFHSCSTSTYSDLIIWNLFWLVVWKIFPYIGNFIIPTDELHHFSEG